MSQSEQNLRRKIPTVIARDMRCALAKTAVYQVMGITIFVTFLISGCAHLIYFELEHLAQCEILEVPVVKIWGGNAKSQLTISKFSALRMSPRAFSGNSPYWSRFLLVAMPIPFIACLNIWCNARMGDPPKSGRHQCVLGELLYWPEHLAQCENVGSACGLRFGGKLQNLSSQ
ncbi:hypothetical protein CPB83DRAFT_837079 [Crepidotus variabilis]|uniref:Uncharacterized protein n=1 Tax=Crepidotus variabilis TaxID=179855 RepID=A0A9P6ECX5_9AGAR|nr:hypothetical protein CPB83DRAFT_837079 [Crepidotus variabilis]